MEMEGMAGNILEAAFLNKKLLSKIISYFDGVNDAYTLSQVNKFFNICICKFKYFESRKVNFHKKVFRGNLIFDHGHGDLEKSFQCIREKYEPWRIMNRPGEVLTLKNITIYQFILYDKTLLLSKEENMPKFRSFVEEFIKANKPCCLKIEGWDMFCKSENKGRYKICLIIDQGLEGIHKLNIRVSSSHHKIAVGLMKEFTKWPDASCYYYLDDAFMKNLGDPIPNIFTEHLNNADIEFATGDQKQGVVYGINSKKFREAFKVEDTEIKDLQAIILDVPYNRLRQSLERIEIRFHGYPTKFVDLMEKLSKHKYTELKSLEICYRLDGPFTDYDINILKEKSRPFIERFFKDGKLVDITVNVIHDNDMKIDEYKRTLAVIVSRYLPSTVLQLRLIGFGNNLHSKLIERFIKRAPNLQFIILRDNFNRINGNERFEPIIDGYDNNYIPQIALTDIILQRFNVITLDIDKKNITLFSRYAFNTPPYRAAYREAFSFNHPNL
uniref:F-box domain-containing protein n=1 Tax=Strongyloides venezuelensis TaxID=75913 RepID=A0A0K0G3J7_STRVS